MSRPPVEAPPADAVDAYAPPLQKRMLLYGVVSIVMLYFFRRVLPLCRGAPPARRLLYLPAG